MTEETTSRDGPTVRGLVGGASLVLIGTIGLTSTLIHRRMVRNPPKMLQEWAEVIAEGQTGQLGWKVRRQSLPVAFVAFLGGSAVATFGGIAALGYSYWYLDLQEGEKLSKKISTLSMKEESQLFMRCTKWLGAKIESGVTPAVRTLEASSFVEYMKEVNKTEAPPFEITKEEVEMFLKEREEGLESTFSEEKQEYLEKVIRMQEKKEKRANFWLFKKIKPFVRKLLGAKESASQESIEQDLRKWLTASDEEVSDEELDVFVEQRLRETLKKYGLDDYTPKAKRSKDGRSEE